MKGQIKATFDFQIGVPVSDGKLYRQSLAILQVKKGAWLDFEKVVNVGLMKEEIFFKVKVCGVEVVFSESDFFTFFPHNNRQR